MVALNSLKPGDRVWSVRRARYRGWDNWQVEIIEVDPEQREVLASWNGNAPQLFSEHHVKRWRRTRKENDRG